MQRTEAGVSFVGLTDRVLQFFDESPDNASSVVARGYSEGTAYMLVAGELVSGLCVLTDLTQRAEFFAAWHRILRSDCSIEYQTIQAENPQMSREDLNATPKMIRLNAIRQAVGGSVQANYRKARAEKLFPQVFSSIARR